MKKKNIDKGFLIALMYPLGVILFTIGFIIVRDIKDRNSSAYRPVWLNSHRNTVTDEESYFYGDDNVLYRYDFETGEREEFCEFDFYWNWRASEGVADRRFDFVIYGDYMFCMEQDNESNSASKLHRYNYRTGEDEILLEDMPLIWGIDICNGYLIYKTYQNQDYYLYPVTGDAGEEPVSVSDIFKEGGDKTNSDVQTVTYEGIEIVGCFAGDTKEIRHISVRDKGSGKELLPRDKSFLLEDGRLVRFYDGDDKYYIRFVDKNDEWEIYEITCLQNKDVGKFPTVLNKYMVQEGDELICLLQIPNDESYILREEIMWQRQSRGDILFKWNIKTGESSILYETSDRNTRIIGYKDGKIYLLHNYWVSVQSVDNGKRQKLFKIPKRRDIYYFDWQGDYLIVADIYKKNEVLVAYKIE